MSIPNIKAAVTGAGEDFNNFVQTFSDEVLQMVAGAGSSGLLASVTDEGLSIANISGAAVADETTIEANGSTKNVILDSDWAKTNNTLETIADGRSDVFQFSGVSGETWKFKCILFVDGHATPDCRMNVTYAGGNTGRYSATYEESANTRSRPINTQTNNIALVTTNGDQSDQITVNGIIALSDTSPVNIQFRQNTTSAGNPVTLLQYSYMTAQKIS